MTPSVSVIGPYITLTPGGIICHLLKATSTARLPNLFLPAL